MPRRVKFHPSVMGIQGGEPGDGDSWNEGMDEPDEGHDEPDAQPEDDRVARMEAEVERLKEENRLIKRAIPPAEPAQGAVDPEGIDGMSDEDFDALLFSNPREALRLNNEKLKRDLRTEYVTNQGNSKFWEQFYAENEDLKDDDDLVQSTLQKNMDELGNMPVDKAKKRLAELTRNRILGFMKKTRGGSGKQRVVAEGANPPSVPVATGDDDTDRPTTMSDMLKARRERRRKAQQAA